MKRALILLAAVVLCTTAQTKDEAQRLLRAAQNVEIVDSNPQAAIKQYEAIVSTYRNDRDVVATALVQMAGSYQKLGDAQAMKIYKRVVREFGDRPAAGEARMKLAAMSPVTSARQTGATRRVAWTITEPADIYAAVSRDGRYLAYGDYRLGELFVRDLTTGVNRRITNTAVFNAASSPDYQHAPGEAAFSPDGRQLAYNWRKSQYAELRVVSLDGDRVGQPRVVVSDQDITYFSPYDWTPDGKSVVVQIGRKDRIFQLAVVSLQDGALRIVKSADWQGDANLFVSPDGRYVAFDRPAASNAGSRGTSASAASIASGSSGTARPNDIFVMTIDGSRELPAIVHPEADDRLMGWSSDWRLVFASDRSGSTDLWVQRFEPSMASSEPQRVRTNIGWFTWSLGMSKSGGLYASTRSSRPSQIRTAVFDFASGTFVSAPTVAAEAFVGPSSNPSWSPDGRFLSWTVCRELTALGCLGTRTLAIRSLADGTTRELRLDLARVEPQFTQWTPDSRGFIVSGADRDGRNGFFRIDAQTGAVSVLALGERLRGSPMPGLTWSPDGTKFRFQRDAAAAGRVNLVEIDLASGAERAFYSGPTSGSVVSRDQQTIYYLSDPSRDSILIARDIGSGQERELARGVTTGPVSRDGRFIAVRKTDPQTKVQSAGIVDTASGQYRELFRAGAPTESLSIGNWAPDDRSVILSKRLQAGSNERVWVPIDGRQPRNLVELGSRDSGIVIHPDGRRVLFTRQMPETPAEVWVLENFLLGPSIGR